jgi:hypothetical protein
MGDDPVEKVKPEIPPAIAKALIAIQKDLAPLIKSASNDAYSSNYVPLEEVTKKAHELLSAHGIGVTQSPVSDEQGHSALETMLFTGSGASYKRTTKLAMNKIDPQAHGSAITYTRRYALMAMLGFTGIGEDDDGNKATGVSVPASVEQIEQVRMLLSLIPWPKEQIDKAVRAIRTKDAADLAIAKYQRITSEIKRDQEAIINVTKVQIGDGKSDDVMDESSPHATIQARLNKIGFASKAFERKFINDMVHKPFLEKVKDPMDLKMLSTALDQLETGKRALPSEYYAPLPKGETRIVEEATDN